jgi:hypothetical protein
MNGEQLNSSAVWERRRGGAMIWAEWRFGKELLFMSRDGTDHLDYYGVDFDDPSELAQWPYYMDGDLDPDGEEFVRWADTHTWHEFESQEEAERWFEGSNEHSLRLRRGD